MSQTGLVPPGHSVVLRQKKAETALQPSKKRMSLSFTSGLRELVAPTLSAPAGVLATGKRATVDDMCMHSGPTASNGGGVGYSDSQLAGLGHESMSNVYGTLSRSALRKLR